MTEITLTNLTKRFDDVTAVDGIDLTVLDGEFITLVGPSGCGKSTTLRLLAGLETPTSGEIFFGDRDVTSTEPKERNVAMVFQNYALYPHMTARRNITFGLGSATTYSDEEIDREVDDAATMLDIDDLLDRKPAALSGGEKQRVAIARAIVRDPDVLLMDEPLSNLDAKLRIQTRAELGELHERLEVTTIYVTHDQAEAMTLGDRVAVMNHGRIEQIDQPQQLYDYPRTQFVAEFIGRPAMNMLAVDVEETPEGYLARADGLTVPLPTAVAVDRPDTDSALASLDRSTALFGIRPEDLDPVNSEDNDPESGDIELSISTTESLGRSTIVHGTVGDQPIVVETDAHFDGQPGDRITVRCDDDRLHLYDRDSGEAIYTSGSLP